MRVPTQQEAAVDSFAKLLCPVDDSPLTEEEDTVETNVLERLSELVACISLVVVQLLWFPSPLEVSEEVRAMLCNKHLRKLLLEVEGVGPKPNSKEQTLDRLMQFPIFAEFADACLRVCGLKEPTPAA